MSCNRYIVEKQLPGCCVPACLRMVFNRHGFAAPSQEEIGNRLGLVVPPEYNDRFSSVSVSEFPPYGTRIHLPQYNLPAAIGDWQIPLQVAFRLIDTIPDVSTLKVLLAKAGRADDDVILCSQADEPGNGHVVLLSGICRTIVSYIDPADGDTWTMSCGDLYKDMKAHGSANYGGCWILSARSP